MCNKLIDCLDERALAIRMAVTITAHETNDDGVVPMAQRNARGNRQQELVSEREPFRGRTISLCTPDEKALTEAGEIDTDLM